MRFAGAVLLSLPLLRLALRRVDTLKQRERLLTSFCDFFRLMSDCAAWRQLELPAMLRAVGAQMSDFSFPSAVLEAFDGCGDLAFAWKLAAEQTPALLRPAEKTALLAFLPVFESAASSVFTEKCALAADRFSAFAENARSERLRQTRLTMSLGVFGAALLMILLL